MEYWLQKKESTIKELESKVKNLSDKIVGMQVWIDQKNDEL